MKNGLEKAYSSLLKMEQRDHGRVVVKTVEAAERKNEIYFHECLRLAGLPSMKAHEEGDSIILDFIEDAETLGDHEIAENYRLFGEVIKKMHDIKYDNPSHIDQDGKQIKITWENFIETQFKTGQERQYQSVVGFDNETTDKIIKFIRDVKIGISDRSVLLHGDLHANNVMKKDKKMILFDKASHILSGDSMYDLSLIVINLPGAKFSLGNNVEHDKQLLEAFIEGYGFDFTRDVKKLEAYVLLRSLERWPNPFEKEIPEIVEMILSN